MNINWNKVACYKTSALKKRRDEVKRLDRKGLLFTEIAEKLNVPYSTVMADVRYIKSLRKMK